MGVPSVAVALWAELGAADDNRGGGCQDEPVGTGECAGEMELGWKPEPPVGLRYEGRGEGVGRAEVWPPKA